MTFSEENYLKIIYHLSYEENIEVTTNAIAEAMQTKASSVTDMLKKLADKQLINYVKLTKNTKESPLLMKGGEMHFW